MTAMFIYIYFKCVFILSNITHFHNIFMATMIHLHIYCDLNQGNQ